MTRATRLAVAVTVVMVLSGQTEAQAANPAAAAARSCDGYGPFSGGSDGLTVTVVPLMGYTTASADASLRRPPPLGNVGQRACDQALSELPDKHWMRRISLLHARAMHRLAVDNVDGAFADLDLAMAAAAEPDDIYFQRSLALSNTLIRAYALRRQGKRDEAARLTLEAWNSRRYSLHVGWSALAALGGSADSADVEHILRGLRLVDPPSSIQLFWRAMDDHRFADAIEAHAALSPPVDYGQRLDPNVVTKLDISPKDDAIFDKLADLMAESFRAQHAGPYAYALAATGKSAKARAALEAARTRLAALPEGPQAEGTTPEPGSYNETRARAQLKGEKALDEWTAIVEQRIAVSEGRMREALDALPQHPISHTTILVDLVDSIRRDLPEELADARPSLDELIREFSASPADDDLGDLKQLFDYLPDPEMSKRVLPYRRKINWFNTDHDGYTLQMRPDETMTVGYLGLQASPTMIEEMALLHAADQALQKGETGFIVVRRRGIQSTTTSLYYGSPWVTYYSGSKVKLDVEFVDLASAPPEARALDAAHIYRTLGPVYEAPVNPGGR